MGIAGTFLVLLGGLFLISAIVSPIAKRFSIPRVTLLLLAGVALGPNGVNIINGLEAELFPFITDVTLLIVGYLLGARLTPDYVRQYASGVLVASVVITIVTCIVVTLILYLVGVDLKVAIVLGAIAAATDPIAMLDVLKEKAKGTRFVKLLEGIVAIDDVLGLFVFSIAMALLGFIDGNSDIWSPLLNMCYEIFGSVILGGLVGYISAVVLNAKPAEESVIVESLAFILLLGGISIYLELSYLLAAMVMGAVMVNVADKSVDHLHEIEYIEQPFLVLFFIIAGSTMTFSSFEGVLSILIMYIAARMIGRYVGAKLVPDRFLNIENKGALGMSLLPQAGIAMGMALLAVNVYPEISDDVLPVAITATVLFEIIGPLMTSKILQSKDIT